VPTADTLWLFAGAALLLLLIPGPNTLYIATRSASQGVRAGVFSALGVETGTLVHILAASLGISALIAASSIAFDVVRYAGAAYLIYLGIRTMLTKPDAASATQPNARSHGRAFISGILVNVLNVKVALFFLALLPQFVDPSRGSAAVQMIVLGLVLLAMGLVFDLAWVFAAGSVNAFVARHPRVWNNQRFVIGSIYIGLGVAAAVTGRTK
jgi:threonine/homoserine/homoserine lactone efflux protein